VGRKKRLPLIENLEIIDVAAEGKSIGKVDNMVVFVPGLIPGDVADVQISRKRKQYMEGFAVTLKKPSPMRIEPFCSHFGLCGGCKWQHLPYDRQLHFKQKQVSDNLQRIGKIEMPEIRPIIGSARERHYRNKLEFTFSDSRWITADEMAGGQEIDDRRALGFHIPGKFDRIVDIETCYLQDDRVNLLRNTIRDFTLKNGYTYYHQRHNAGFMRNLIVRNTLGGEWMLIVVFNENDEEKISLLMDFIRKEIPFITSLNYVINPKLNDTIHDLEVHCYAGKDHMVEKLEDLTFKIGPKSFFQTNTEQALKLYEITREFADLTGNETVYDLYTGTGTIANFIARQAKHVVGIESVEDAIADARINSEINGIQNTRFFAGDMRDILKEDFIMDHGRPDVIITDPPRAGMHADVIQVILQARPERIVYVSCNPATQARDIQLLSDTYRVTKIQPVDMFPHTHHVENVVQLLRK
jgi:23S rRNA (uracil1939-C5)-methyltransferase